MRIIPSKEKFRVNYNRANTISEPYKSRWQIEIFFREIKQRLHIKSFIGTTENTVMIQIWTAMITILILKRKSKTVIRRKLTSPEQAHEVFNGISPS